VASHEQIESNKSTGADLAFEIFRFSRLVSLKPQTRNSSGLR